jgi:glycine cleavage system H protein
MSGPTSDKGIRIVPSDDLKCVWMTAGILSYQLCERRFDCERCPLDAALRMHFGRPAAAAGERRPGRPTGRLAGDRRYGRRHGWVQRMRHVGEGPVLHRVGLEPGLAAAMLRPRSVVHPVVGGTVRAGQPCLWIVTEGGTFAFASPVEGVVRTVNTDLDERPSLLAEAPLQGGWLYDVELDEDPATGTGGLMDARAAVQSYAEDRERFQGELAKALRGHAAPTPALADGGAPLAEVWQMLGPERYFSVLCKVYG